MNGKGSNRRKNDSRYCTEEELTKRWELIKWGDKEDGMSKMQESGDKSVPDLPIRTA